MNALAIAEIQETGEKTLDSREVAEMVDKQHPHLMRDIAGYIDALSQSNFGFADFFIESTYKDAQGKTRPCYLITRKGCEMVANKMTGAKGVQFTAAYINRFHELESGNMIDAARLSPQLQLLTQMVNSMAVQELKQAEMQQQISAQATVINTIQDTIIQRDENEDRADDEAGRYRSRSAIERNLYQHRKRTVYQIHKGELKHEKGITHNRLTAFGL